MLRGDPSDAQKGFNADAVGWALDEVTRYGAAGTHPRLVRLLDVGLFQEVVPRNCNSPEESTPRTATVSAKDRLEMDGAHRPRAR
eukprot:5565919-Pyramimonas_sp.AAC.1